MSKQSKSKRDEKRRRRSKSAPSAGRSGTQDKDKWYEKRSVWLGLVGALLAVLVVALVLRFVIGRVTSSTPDSSMPQEPSERNGMYSAPPRMQIDTNKAYFATMQTGKGDISIELFDDRAPETVNNFVFLAREGFFDSTAFHRVIPGFMAQAGDPTSTGTGGPGYRFADEFDPELRHDVPGVLSMANMGANTNGSQFFITYEPTPWLDAYDSAGNLKDCERPDVSCHAVFGRVTDGMQVVEALAPRDPSANPVGPGDIIYTILIEER
jgi:cyclophilin family peptidyl-prolyl cis-trans isomerase